MIGGKVELEECIREINVDGKIQKEKKVPRLMI